MKKIFSITVVDVGKIFARSQVKRENKRPYETTWIIVETPIEPFTMRGEMAEVPWYRQGNREWNGKFVIEIEYYEAPTA